MTEKWQKYLDTIGHVRALLTDLSKPFDSIDHQLLHAKLNAYGVDANSLYFLASYLEKRKPRRKNGSYSNFDGIFSGVSQGSILGPLLINIYICDLFFGIWDLDIASHADDNTPYTFSSELEVTLKKLRIYTIKIFEWFYKNCFKSNGKKYNFTTSSTSPVEIQIENTITSSINRIKLLSVPFDGRLDFNYHLSEICKNANKILQALSTWPLGELRKVHQPRNFTPKW